MATVPLIPPGIRGIDGQADPLTLLGNRKLRHAVNLLFQDGVISTRPGFIYHPLGIQGQFQGTTLFCPSLGLSMESFGHNGAQLATAVSGGLYLNGVTSSSVGCKPMKLAGTEETGGCIPLDPKCRGNVNLFQAENYLIVTNKAGPTYWWDGRMLTPSPGMTADSEQDDVNHSHDNLCSDLFKNWLINGAGLSAYVHGRIHLEQGAIYVSDMIHKRGHLVTNDITLMEEQSLDDPLSTNSKMGSLVALEVLTQMDTPNGEGELVGYYEGGVVTYNTFEVREFRNDGEGNPVQKGWSDKRLINHRVKGISAVGRYSVADTPSDDHIFRSPFGVHLLTFVRGKEVIKDATINTVSQEVEPILNSDLPELTAGVACGYWIRGHRVFVSTGLETSEPVSSSPFAKGFVVWNKLFARTQDRTPVTAWEGVWAVDDHAAGIHRFSHIGLRADEGGYGFVSSDLERNLYFTTLHRNALEDSRGGSQIPIPWALETGRFTGGSLSVLKTISDARFEGVFASHTARVKVWVRTDRKPAWARWREFVPCERKLDFGQKLLKGESIGQPPEGYREANWFEFRIEGVGWAEIRSFDIEVTESQTTAGKSLCVVVDSPQKNYLSAQL